MKSIKITILSFAFFVVCLNNTGLQAENTKVDSVYNIVKGTWYEVYEVNGMTGDLDSIYTNDSTVISRISATDSISWKQYKSGLLVYDLHYLISYSNSLLYKTDKWMLKSGDTRLLVLVENNGFSYYLDAFDGGGVGYSHTKIPNGLSEDNVSIGKFKVIQNQNNSISIIGNTKLLKVAIYDLNGKKEKSWMNVESGQMMDVSELHSGIFMVILEANNEHFISRILKN